MQRKPLITGVFAALMSYPGVGVCAERLGADTIFYGGTILTVDQDFSEQEALSIRDNRILAVGTLADVQQSTAGEPQLIDLEGGVMLPGFIDAHGHPIMAAVYDAAMEYVGADRFRSTDEVLAQLRILAETTPEGEWIAARNYDPAVQAGPDALTVRDLDTVSTKHPIFVQNASGHIAYVNSAALAVAGIPPNIENPPGAEFVRDGAGQLNGVIKNSVAILQVTAAIPALADADGMEALITMSNKFNQYGMTTYGDLATGAFTKGPEDVVIMRRAAASGRLSARLRGYPMALGDLANAWAGAGFKPGQGDAMVRLVGVKLAADGSNQGYTGLQREPYLGTANRGMEYTSTEELTRLAIEYGSQGWQIAVHGNGDRAIDNILDAFEAAQKQGVDLKATRPRIEHCSILHDDQIARMKALGVSASFLIGHVNYWGVDFRDHIFGPNKARLLDRARSVEQAGISFSLHSDWTVTEPRALQLIETAVTRLTWKEQNFSLAPEEAVTVESAIRAVTIQAAWQLHSEHEIGSLLPGKLADMVVLEQDPRAVEAAGISEIRVLQTWFDGRQVFQAD